MTKITLTHLQAVAEKPKKRVGRGYGSGKGGHTSSRGQKGQNSRVGKNVPLWFEGGQLPMVKRTPFLRGKDRFDRLVQRYQIVTLTQLSKFSDKDEITADVLKARKIIRSASVPVKIIATGELKKAVTVRCLVSAGAKTAIERAGGSVILPEIVKPAELEKRVSKKAVKKEKYKAAKKAADKLAGK